MGFSFSAFSQPRVPVYASGHKNSNTSPVLGAYTVLGLSETSDSHGTYDGTTYTCPSNSAGIYQVIITAQTTEHDGQASLFKISCSVNGTPDNTYYASSGDGSASDKSKFIVYSRYLNLSVADTVEMCYYVTNAGSNHLLNSVSFSICKV